MKIQKALKSRSNILDLVVTLGNFLFSEPFDGEFIKPAFLIYLYFCQKHTQKASHLTFHLILPVGMG